MVTILSILCPTLVDQIRLSPDQTHSIPARRKFPKAVFLETFSWSPSINILSISGVKFSSHYGMFFFPGNWESEKMYSIVDACREWLVLQSTGSYNLQCRQMGWGLLMNFCTGNRCLPEVRSDQFTFTLPLFTAYCYCTGICVCRRRRHDRRL